MLPRGLLCYLQSNSIRRSRNHSHLFKTNSDDDARDRHDELTIGVWADSRSEPPDRVRSVT